MRTKIFDLHNTAAATVYYPQEPSSSLDGRRTLLTLLGSGGVTYTIERTGDNKAKDDAQLSADVWFDVTNTCPNIANAGATAASYVNTNCVLDVSHLTAGRWQIVRVTSDATNDCRATLDVGPGTAMPGGGPLGGAASETTLSEINGHVHSIDAGTPAALGTAAMAAAMPVTIATDDTLTLAIKNDVDKIPAKGTAAMAGSTPVTLATDDTVSAALAALVTTPGTATAITASDVTDTTAATAKGILVGGAGTVVVDGVVGGSAITITAVAGQYIPIRAAKVKAASTATGLVGLS